MQQSVRVLVTGASGFVGRSLIRILTEHGYVVRATSRHSIPVSEVRNNSKIDWVKYDLCDEYIDYTKLLEGVEFVIHLAGLAHVTGQHKGTLKKFRMVNVAGTRKLATEAAGRGIRRFIFISTVKVHGETNTLVDGGHMKRFVESDTPEPKASYAISKLEAEQVVKDVCNAGQMKYVILRPPLIYGPYVKAYLLRLIELIAKGIPLPFASINNQRSLLYVDNLGHAIVAAIERPAAVNNTYLVSDVDISLPQLIREISRHFDQTAKLFSLPVPLLRFAGRYTGQQAVVDRLTESLVLDSHKIRRELKWSPAVSFEDGLKTMVDWYKSGMI